MWGEGIDRQSTSNTKNKHLHNRSGGCLYFRRAEKEKIGKETISLLCDSGALHEKRGGGMTGELVNMHEGESPRSVDRLNVLKWRQGGPQQSEKGKGKISVG